MGRRQQVAAVCLYTALSSGFVCLCASEWAHKWLWLAVEESLQLLLTNDATKTRHLSRNRIYSNCQRLLWEFFWAAFEFLNAVHFNNSIIKTDTGPGRARWSSGDVAQIYFCSFIAALLDFREGDRARGNYRRRRTKRSGDTLWRCDIKNNCWQTGKTTRPSFTSMFLLEIYFFFKYTF